jgi:hypothetical protein
MSAETKEKIRKARKARKKHPREGQSKKSKSFYDVIRNDYSDLAKKDKDVAEWLAKNKTKLKSMDSMQYGILNEYQEMYVSWREFRLENIVFGKNANNVEENILKEDHYDFMDEEDVEQEYEELISEDFYIEYD